jgi:ssDNA-binding Zn-finger/Zn-ribbon topoisomerase 1
MRFELLRVDAGKDPVAAPKTFTGGTEFFVSVIGNPPKQYPEGDPRLGKVLLTLSEMTTERECHKQIDLLIEELGVLKKQASAFFAKTEIAKGKCPKCGSDLEQKTIENRIRLRCTKCRFLEYKNPSSSVGPDDVVIDDILDDIVKQGHHEAMTALVNLGFRAMGSLESWCKTHGFGWEVFLKKEGRKETEWVRISRNF